LRLKIKPRDYQIEAAEWALKRKGAVVVMPTGSGKTLIAILWAKKLMETGEARRIIFLEPSRILVEQVASYINKVLGVKALPIHGKYPKNKRKSLWMRAKIAVTTPETALSDHEIIASLGYNVVVVDECHHTTGKDAYAEFMKKMKFDRRLGLSAHIPRAREPEITRYIGPIRRWSWNDERIKKYVPPWIGEIYEAELNNEEKSLLERLEDLRLDLSGRDRGLVNLAIRWFVRDGALALKESIDKESRLSFILSPIRPYLDKPGIRPAHKLDALLRILRDHDFNKAIVFVDRVIIAKYLEKILSKQYGAVAIYGKAKMKEDVRKVLHRAHSEQTKVVISTSAGEEGLDLPMADLLVIWSNVASPLRFIQRHGRILRLTGRKGLKFVAYIVTPDTPDMDSLVDSLEFAKKSGIDIPVDEEVLERLWRRTTRDKILSILEGRPMPLEWIAEAIGWPYDIVAKALRKLMERGEILYIYTHLGKVYAVPDDIDILYEEYQEYLKPDLRLHGKAKYVVQKSSRAVSGTYSKILSKLRKILEKNGKIERLTFTFEIPLPIGSLKLVNINYTFTIFNEKALKLVCDNAFSVQHFQKFLPGERNE